MPDNRTLDEFEADESAPDADVAPAADARTEDAPAGTPEAGVGDGAEADTPTVEPIEGVYRYDPVSVPCDDCGDEVARRWRDGDSFVCERCKPW